MKCNISNRRYIGETGRNVDTREEHCAPAQNGRPKLLAVAEQAMAGHDVDWSAKIIERASKMWVRCTRVEM